MPQRQGSQIRLLSVLSERSSKSISKASISKNQAVSRLRDLSNEMDLNNKNSIENSLIRNKSRNRHLQTGNGSIKHPSSMFNTGQKPPLTTKGKKSFEFRIDTGQSPNALKMRHIFSPVNQERKQINHKNILKDVKNNLAGLCMDLGVEKPAPKVVTYKPTAHPQIQNL